MKILFDHQAFSNQKYGGISRYHANLHAGVKATPGMQSKLGLLFTHNAYVDKADLPAAGLFGGLIGKQSRRDKYNKWYCRHLLKQGDFDIFHPTYYNPYFLKTLNKPFILTVHDMIHELHPEYFEKDPYTLGYKQQVIPRADHIITISESTKNDLKKFYNIADDKITVIHLGNGIQVAAGTVDATQTDRYLLFVGDRPGYKNFEVFIKAITPLLLKQHLNVVCVGGGAFTDEEWQLFTLLHITANVSQVFATDTELANLYANAEAFVFPSLYEGFGLPTLEAFYNECPAVLSNTSSLPEVGGEAAQYFDPRDADSILDAVEQVVNNNTRQNELRSLGAERLKLFTNQVCVQNTINVYKQLR